MVLKNLFNVWSLRAIFLQTVGYQISKQLIPLFLFI